MESIISAMTAAEWLSDCLGEERDFFAGRPHSRANKKKDTSSGAEWFRSILASSVY